MQILMLFTRYGSEDGFIVRRFLQNHQYEMADSLAAYFIRLGLAKPLNYLGENNVKQP